MFFSLNTKRSRSWNQGLDVAIPARGHGIRSGRSVLQRNSNSSATVETPTRLISLLTNPCLKGAACLVNKINYNFSWKNLLFKLREILGCKVVPEKVGNKFSRQRRITLQPFLF